MWVYSPNAWKKYSKRTLEELSDNLSQSKDSQVYINAFEIPFISILPFHNDIKVSYT